VKHARLFLSLALAVVGARMLALARCLFVVSEPAPRSMQTVKGGFFSVLPRERRAYEVGAKWHEAFSPKTRTGETARWDLDSVEAHNRALELAFKAQQFEGEA
jgi:hypothetical protein